MYPYPLIPLYLLEVSFILAILPLIWQSNTGGGNGLQRLARQLCYCFSHTHFSC